MLPSFRNFFLANAIVYLKLFNWQIWTNWYGLILRLVLSRVRELVDVVIWIPLSSV